jgi:hypothetical protein
VLAYFTEEMFTMRYKFFALITTLILFCFGHSVQANKLPLKEHEMLKMDEGVWDAHLTIWRGHGKAPSKATFKETNTMIGELWSIGTMEGNIDGNDFIGFATLGYDPMQKKYVGTWIDSMTPVIANMIGDYDEITKTLVLFYTTYNEVGLPEYRKNVMIYKDHNTRDFMMYIKKQGEWVKASKTLYQRVK